MLRQRVPVVLTSPVALPLSVLGRRSTGVAFTALIASFSMAVTVRELACGQLQSAASCIRVTLAIIPSGTCRPSQRGQEFGAVSRANFPTIVSSDTMLVTVMKAMHMLRSGLVMQQISAMLMSLLGPARNAWLRFVSHCTFAELLLKRGRGGVPHIGLRYRR